jgi:hypothetical protein
LRPNDVYRLDDNTLRIKLFDAIQHIQNLKSSLSSTRASLAQSNLQNSILRTESREISQRCAVETELAKREVEVLLREYEAQMPSANQLANTYYRRYRGLKLRVKDLEAEIESKDAEIKRLQEYVRENGITVPKEGSKRTRRTGLKYAPRGGPWAAAAGKAKQVNAVPRTLKPAPSLQSNITKSDTVNSQESQSSGLDALGMLASQVLDSQESQFSQKYATQIPSSQYVPSTPLKPSQSTPSLLSPLPIPTTKRRRAGSRASDSTIDHDPALTESEKSPTKIRVVDESDEEIKESPPGSQINPYATALPIPYRATRNGNDTFPTSSGGDNGGPRRKLNFDLNDSDQLDQAM